MSSDPHAPTPAGPDPDDKTEVHPATGDAVTDPAPAEATGGDVTPVETEVVETERVETTPVETEHVETTVVETETEPSAAQDDWLRPDAEPAAPAPDPVVQTPSAFTPPGTPGDAQSPLDKAKAIAEKPEGMVGLAFLGGAVLSFVLKRFGR